MRARVNERLEQATRFPVTLIVAPAGFGKSVALRDFLGNAQRDVVRYDVRRDDGTLLAFVRRFSEALEPVAPSAIASFASMQERVLAVEEPVRQLSDWFAEHLKDVRCTIAIDDLHFAAVERAPIALVADLVERTSERIRWIIAARSDVGLPVATWMAYGRMDFPVGEEDLRFTIDEALTAAEQSPAHLELQEVEALRQLTEGWPVALTIALRTRTHSADLRTASSGTREMIYRYLAEQVFTGLSPQQRDLALATCVFAEFDAELAQALGAEPALFADFRSRIAFLNEVNAGVYRYHDLFRDFLETELRRSGEREWSRALGRGGRLLEERGDEAAALVLFTKARSQEDLLRILERSGAALLERGGSETLAAALNALPESARGGSAAALGLAATIEAGRGRFKIAQSGFAAAIERAQERDLRITLVNRYAIELVRNGLDCSQLLEPYASDESLPETLRIPLLGTLATAYARGGRLDDAQAIVERALALSTPSMDGELLARLYQQAAYVHHFGPDQQQAETYANLAVELALPRGLFDVAARAYSVLYSVAYNKRDDPVECLAILERLDECARKTAGVQARLYALVASYELEAERGNDEALETLHRALREHEGALPHVGSEALLPADALRKAWHADFRGALALLEGSAGNLEEDDRRALREAEIALYAAASGASEQAHLAIEHAARALEGRSEETRRSIRSRVFLALAEMVRGHTAAAHRYLTEAERSVTAQMPRLRVLVAAAREFYRAMLEQAEPASAANSLQQLRDRHFGGIARLLEALPFPDAQGSSAYGALTGAEREILQMLVGGASTKQVASKTGRSPHTVDTHIRSICRKLQCSGRREAVALATARGWVR